MKKWHGGKGSNRRPTNIMKYEEDLRWELIKSSTTPERKSEIKRELEIINCSKILADNI